MATKIRARPHKTYHWNLFTWNLRPETGVPEGSTLTYVNTGEGYIFNNGMWEPDLTNKESYNRNVLFMFSTPGG